MYKKSAKYYDAIFNFLDYEAASKELFSIIQKLNPRAKTLLDVGCGTGKHLEYLKEYFKVEGLDISNEMLKVARRRLDGIPLHRANMIDFKLNRSFDVITCLFSSIAGVKSITNLYRTITNMSNHLNKDGILIIEPLFSPDKFVEQGIIVNIVDQPNIKIARMYKIEREGSSLITIIHYLVGTKEGISYFSERHEGGMFKNEDYQQAFFNSGIKADFDPVGLFKRGLYIGKKIN